MSQSNWIRYPAFGVIFAILGGLAFWGGLPAIAMGVFIALLSNALHKRVHGYDIAQIRDEDYHDHPNNPRNRHPHLFDQLPR